MNIKATTITPAHVCDPDGQRMDWADWPAWMKPGAVVAILGTAGHGRVRMLWTCCGTLVVDRLNPRDDSRTYLTRYALEDVRAIKWPESYSVPCIGAAWSLHLPCGCLAGECQGHD